MITAIADRHALAVIEDGGGSHGATFRGRRAGSWGHGAFGFYGAGEGGLISTNDDRLADWIPTLSRSRPAWPQRRDPGFRLPPVRGRRGDRSGRLVDRTGYRSAPGHRRSVWSGLRRPAHPPHPWPGRPASRLPPLHDRGRSGSRRRGGRPSRAWCRDGDRVPGSPSIASRTCSSEGSTPSCRSPTRRRTGR